jgi:hypothetical protein
MEKKK